MNENEYPPPPLPKPMERNPVTWEKHRREVRRQIALPLVLGSIIVLTLAVLVPVLGTNPEVSQWANVSLIWLITPILLFSLVGLIILIAIVYGLFRLLKVLPYYTRTVQDYFNYVKDWIAVMNNKLVAPILGFESGKSSLRALRRNLTGK